MNTSRPDTLTEDALLSQINKSDIEAVRPLLEKLHELTKTKPPQNTRLWEKAWAEAERKAKGPERDISLCYILTEKIYRRMDAKYAKALSQKQKKIAQVMKKIEPILRSESAEALLRYDKQHGGNLRIIARQIVDHKDRKEWYFGTRTIADAILFLLQVKGKLPLWYDKPTGSKPTKPTEASGGKTPKLSQETPKTDPKLIYQAAAAEFYNIPKSTLSKAANKRPGEVGYLWSGRNGKRVFYRKSDCEKLARSRAKLR